MAHDEMTRSQCQRHAGQHHRRQRSQPQKTLGALQRRADFRTRIAHILQLLSHGQPALQPVAKISHLRRFTRHQQTIADAAAFLHQPTGDQIGKIDQHARRQTGEADRLVYFAHHARGQAQVQCTQPDLVAQLQAQGLHQTLIRP